MKGKYNLDFSINTDHKVAISKAGIAFGSGVIRTLGYPEKVNLGIDKANGIIGVKVAREPDKFIKAYPFCTKQKRTWLRIASKPILQAIEEITGITYGNTATNYPAYYDKDEKILIVNLKQTEDEQGYRKQSEVVKDVFERIIEETKAVQASGYDGLGVEDIKRLAREEYGVVTWQEAKNEED